jgi:hypothetical protein
LRQKAEVSIVTVSSTVLPIAMALAVIAAPSAQRGSPASAAQRGGSPPSAAATSPAAGTEDLDVKVSLIAPPPAVGTVIVPLTVHIDRYTPEHARTKMVDALRVNAYPGFLRALRESPRAGYFDLNGRKIVVRWARQVTDDSGRTLSFVTDAPVYFVGGALKNAKPTGGYEVAVMQLRMDKNGKGDGTLAAAARVKPLDVTGVQLDDYAEAPLKVTAVARVP